MMKVVMKLEFADEKMKRKAMKKVSDVPGVESMAVDPKDNKLTVTGNVDAVAVVERLRQLCRTEILSVGPAKEPEKKIKDEPKKGEPEKVDPVEILKIYYQNQLPPPQYFCRSREEDPNACVIS